MTKNSLFYKTMTKFSNYGLEKAKKKLNKMLSVRAEIIESINRPAPFCAKTYCRMLDKVDRCIEKQRKKIKDLQQAMAEFDEMFEDM